MGLLDRAKALAGQHPDQVRAAIDKAEEAADQATKGKYSKQIDSAGETAADYVEKLDDK